MNLISINGIAGYLLTLKDDFGHEVWLPMQCIKQTIIFILFLLFFKLNMYQHDGRQFIG